MSRDIPVGNGSLLVNFDRAYQLRDLYWPYVGQENHTNGHPFRFGVWVEDRFSWVHDPAWQRTLDYAGDTLVTNVELKHAEMAVSLTCQDAVDFHENLFIRRIEARNESDRAREVRLFFAHDFHIGGNPLGDTAYYEPERQAMYHYKGKRWFMINTARRAPEGWTLGIDQWAAGSKEVPGHEGTWRDAEDGTLSGNPVAQGSVDSTVALHLFIPARGAVTAYYWIAVGEDFAEVTRINRAVREKGPPTFLERTRHYWALWVSAQCGDQCAELLTLPPPVRRLYRRSLLVIRTQVDNRGAIIAANDFDITHYGRDTYSYMWPRDGALVAAALIDAGYFAVPQRFFDFCHRVLTDEGYLLHKYTPDGSLASSWHAWYWEGQKHLPVQEDETALVLWALWRFFRRFREVEVVKPLFRGLIVRAANWLAAYRDARSGLPLRSWDLWEERYGVMAWTVGAAWAGLQAAANFCDAFGEEELARHYRGAAEEMRIGATMHLWCPGAGRFARLAYHKPDGSWDHDSTVDASLVGLWLFGMFAPDDPKIVATMEALRETLRVNTEVGGLARYEHDAYHLDAAVAERLPGNPWFVCTLWLTQWQIARAQTAAELKPALEGLDWALRHALPSGIMPEQIDPATGAPISVSPLTWSHAAFVAAVQALQARQAEFRLRDAGA